jgi:FeS assembly SUF system protein
MANPPKSVPLGTQRLNPENGGAGSAAPAPEPDKDLREQVIDVLKTCYDPEVPVNIYELGLIYDLTVSPEGAAHIRMTLTSPACPVAGSLPGEVETKVRKVPGLKDVKVELVWDPPWDKDRMSEAAQLQLGLF